MASLKIVKDKPTEIKEQPVFRDANDVLSSFPGQKDIRKTASPEQQNRRDNAGKGKWR